MSVSITEVGLFFLGLYLLLAGISNFKPLKIGKLNAVFAIIAGVCILLGLFVTEAIVLN